MRMSVIQGNQVYCDHLWLWNEEHSRFEGVPEYDEIPVPDLDEETKTIYGCAPSSAGEQDFIPFTSGMTGTTWPVCGRSRSHSPWS